MGVLGISDLKNLIHTPTLVNETELKRVTLADGVTFDQVLADVNAALALLSNDMLNMQWYSPLLSVQTSPVVKYNVGSSGNDIEEATEYGIPKPYRHSPGTGHSLPITKYDRALGWTMMYLRDAQRDDVDADFAEFGNDARNQWQKKLLQRLFKSAAEPVAGVTGQSVPLADGGTADSNYVPPISPEGKSFLYTHNHFMRQSATDDAAVTAVLANLREHGHTSPFEIIASATDAATWRALTGFRSPTWPGIEYRDTTSRAMLSGDLGYGGYFECVHGVGRIWFCPRVPTLYYAAYKAYGQGSARNPIRVRVNKNFGFGWKLVPGQWVNSPMHLAVMLAEFGIGIGEDRTNGVANYTYSSGSYVDPTIT